MSLCFIRFIIVYYCVIMMKICIIFIVLSLFGHYLFIFWFCSLCCYYLCHCIVIVLSLYCHHDVTFYYIHCIAIKLSLYCHHDVTFYCFHLLVTIWPIYIQFSIDCHQIVIMLSLWCFLYCVHSLVIILSLYGHFLCCDQLVSKLSLCCQLVVIVDYVN